MFERGSTEAVRSLDTGGKTDILMFLGGALVFPNSILRIAEQEAGGVHAVRVDTLRDMLMLSRSGSFSVRKVFFDDLLLDDILDSFDTLCANLPAADWVLAYRDKAVARRLLAQRGTSAQVSKVLLLPMTLPICPWASMLRLVLSGQFIASGDLIDFEPDIKTNTPADTAKALKPLPDPRGPHVREQPSPPPDAPKQVQVDHTIAGKACTLSDLGLTPREKEVLAHVSQGGRNKTIAHKMSLSEHTVKLHLHNAITKIGARNRTEAATWYLSRQIGGGYER